MANSIAATVERIKRDPLNVLDRNRIHGVCEELGHAWRERELDPATTLALFLQQVLHGNCPCSPSAPPAPRRRPRGVVHRLGVLRRPQAPAAGGLPGDAHRGRRRGAARHAA